MASALQAMRSAPPAQSGAQTRMRAPAASVEGKGFTAALASSPPWDHMTPFGRAVVPLVYTMTARSSGAASTGGSSRAAPARARS
jgi:hypothetical protein